MGALFFIGFAVSATLSWRLITVVTTSTDAQQRTDAIKMFGYIWGGGTIGTGLVSGAVKLYELGVLR
jgi:hypothetical protein